MNTAQKTGISLLLLLLFAASQTFAQDLNSPYSSYGIGDFNWRAFNRTSGMANTGLALKSSYFVVDNNPAGLIGLDRSFYGINLALNGKFVKYSGTPITVDNASNKDFYIERFGLAVKINNWWASAAGFRKFSNVSYSFTNPQAVEGGTTTYDVKYEGNGGVNDFYWTNAFQLGKHFSVGVKTSFLSGSVNQTDSINDVTLNQTIAANVQDYYSHIRFESGAIYSGAVSKKWDLSLAGKFIAKTLLPASRTLTVTENTIPIIPGNYIKNTSYTLPDTYSAGIALKNKSGTTFAADYNFENWNPLNISGSGWSFVSSHRITAGAEFAKFKNYLNTHIETKFFQLGAYFNNSYLSVNNHQIQEFGLTGGMGGILGGNLLYTIGADVGTRGTTSAGLIKENYFQITFTINYRDFLYSKGRKFF